MSSEFWQSALLQIVSRLKSPPRVAILGIGHELRGDDAAGLAVVRALTSRDDLLVIEAGSAPENHAGALRRFRPKLVLLIDSAQMNLAPGDIRLLDFGSLAGLSASTHTTPLSLLARYLTAELECDVRLLGIQPGNNALDALLTPEVRRTVEQMSTELQRLFQISA